MDTVKLVIVGVILLVVALAAWGVKHAVDVFGETQKENATLKVQNSELATTLREETRTTGILFEVAKSNAEVKNAVNGTVGRLTGELRALRASDPEVAVRATLAVPVPVVQRLRKWPTDSEGYPLVPGPGNVDPANPGAGGK